MPAHISVLDTLRATAVLFVLADHMLETVSPWHPYDWYLGRLGVLLFFVHTACVLMLSLQRTARGGGAVAWAFYVRRAFRLYPLAIACVALVVLLQVPRNAWGAEPPAANLRAILANLLLVQNLVGVPSATGPLWSLPLEVQMYVLLPAVFWVIRRGAAPRRAWLLWGAGVAAGLVAPMSSQILIPFVPCFLAGVLAFCLLSQVDAEIPGWAWPPILLAVAAGYVAFSRLFTAVHVKPAAWGACLIVALLIPLMRRVPGAIAVPAAVIAKYSYGIYLSHLPALWFAFRFFDGMPAWGQWLVFLVTMTTATVTGYHLIEAPMIRLGTRLAERRADVPARAVLAL